MKKWIFLAAAIFFLILPAHAAEVPENLTDALPREAQELLGDTKSSDAVSLGEGILSLAKKAAGQVKSILRERLRSAVLVLLVVLLCGVVDGLGPGTINGGLNLTAMAGALSVSLLTAGSLDSLIGLGAGTIRSMSDFSKMLLPTLAAAAAAAGAIGSATVQQVTTVFFVDLLLQLIQGLLLPVVYLYIGVLTAAAMLPGNSLGGMAEALKKGVTWILSAVLIAFTVYLSVVRVIAGTADGAAVKVARAAISGAVPVVGSILSEASETVLAGAGVLKGTIGVFGTLAVLAICAYPFLQLGVQYLLYKLTAFLAGTVGSSGLCKLIDGLGSAFGLVLGMTGACALLLLVSIMSFVAAVTP